ncbi:hypothetical protein [Flavilitoribacter nigricans]|uniref:VWA containing CoxE family protein n=1 Tax=Flavilitoribacter nigricans (strain ATCC 23147 / DSM 23189 / NBRC 102662 / NCIMB 1420 / SS-2) TaxID=1122177 RepID=A0A2D0MYJ9_FLAN2|nr:hypothetical protein [Flavilitoribacter nigricans]PHN01196.1 hypothetical protein CRP01_38295 [Flavilitoribacter nigricans DSM 23189 = NBRC 102662]
MNGSIGEPLIFWPFFERLEKELSYERWLDKYRLFQQALMSGAVPYDEEWRAFRQFCKFLYLQDHNDEARFDELLDEAIAEEKNRLLAVWQQLPGTGPRTPEEQDVEIPEKEEEDRPSARPPVTQPSQQRTAPPPPEPATETKFFHPQFDIQLPEEGGESEAKRTGYHYLHTDEYFPANRREMVKSWQYLRRMERAGASSRINIVKTVQRIAKEGVFIEPEYEDTFVNRQDILFLFADTRGSMTPFHELTKRLVLTAKGEGGHRRAPTFFFQNAPLEYLFRAPNLTDPVPMKQAVQRANRNISYAFIISDAGAARGNDNREQIERRVRLIRPFLQLLQSHMAYVIWLNPMPYHRWKGTAAEAIAAEPAVTTMVPVLEEGEFNYQDVIRRIIKYKRLNLDE